MTRVYDVNRPGKCRCGKVLEFAGDPLCKYCYQKMCRELEEINLLIDGEEKTRRKEQVKIRYFSGGYENSRTDDISDDKHCSSCKASLKKMDMHKWPASEFLKDINKGIREGLLSIKSDLHTGTQVSRTSNWDGQMDFSYAVYPSEVDANVGITIIPCTICETKICEKKCPRCFDMYTDCPTPLKRLRVKNDN
jgi:hypothetical protein